MAHDTQNPDRAGKDMDMDDTDTPRCAESGCLHPVRDGNQKCRKHSREDLADSTRDVRAADSDDLTAVDDADE